MTDKKAFTVKDGLSVQAGNLVFWEGLLKPHVYAKLEHAVRQATEGKELKTGYDVPRGQDIDTWILNIHNDYNPLHK